MRVGCCFWRDSLTDGRFWWNPFCGDCSSCTSRPLHRQILESVVEKVAAGTELCAKPRQERWVRSPVTHPHITVMNKCITVACDVPSITVAVFRPCVCCSSACRSVNGLRLHAVAFGAIRQVDLGHQARPVSSTATKTRNTNNRS